MGTWNIKLFSNDVTCDVKDAYLYFLKEGLSNEEAYQKTFHEYRELMGTDEEALFWYALADVQWEVGRLMPKVKTIALEFISKKGGEDLWNGDSKRILKWQTVLQDLKQKIESPVPPEKKIKKQIEFVKNPWNVGDIYAYRFHTKIAEEQGLLNQYILFQKVGNVEYYEHTFFSVVQVFNGVFDHVPNLEEVKSLSILPFINPPGIGGTPDRIEDYVPSFDWYMKSCMIYDKKSDYPQKNFTFIGCETIPEFKCNGNEVTSMFWERDGMEIWLVEYYLCWKDNNTVFPSCS